MEELTMEQIVELGQRYYPDMTPEIILQKFEEIKAQLPPDFSNLEIAQVIFASKNDSGGASRFGDLLGKLRK